MVKIIFQWRFVAVVSIACVFSHYCSVVYLGKGFVNCEGFVAGGAFVGIFVGSDELIAGYELVASAIAAVGAS